MAIRGIDNQILITKAQEVSADRARVQQQNSQQQGQLTQRLQSEAARAEERPPEVTETEDGRIGPEDRRSKPGEEQAGQEKKEEETRREEELSAAAQKLLNLPVERGRYARREEHQIDIVV